MNHLYEDKFELFFLRNSQDGVFVWHKPNFFVAIELQKAELLIEKLSKRPIYVDATGTSTQIRSNVDALRAMIRF